MMEISPPIAVLHGTNGSDQASQTSAGVNRLKVEKTAHPHTTTRRGTSLHSLYNQCVTCYVLQSVTLCFVVKRGCSTVGYPFGYLRCGLENGRVINAKANPKDRPEQKQMRCHAILLIISVLSASCTFAPSFTPTTIEGEQCKNECAHTHQLCQASSYTCTRAYASCIESCKDIDNIRPKEK
jgi:hypothetical protein